MVIRVSATVVGAGDDGILDQDGEIGFSWVGEYETGETVDRIKYVVAPNGVLVNEPTPTLDADDEGRALNGSMLNTGRLGHGAKPQALDGRLASYDSDLLPAYPVLMRPGDSLIKTKSKAPLGSGGTRGGVSEYYGGLHVVAAHPPAGAFGAPFVWPSTDIADRPWRVVDLDTCLSKLPAYSSLGMDVEAWSYAKARIGPLDLGRALSQQDSAPGYEYLTRYFASSTTSNYGRYLTQLTSFVAVGLLSDAWSAQDKTEAFIDFLRMGCQFGEPIFKAGGISGLGGGGHDYGFYAPCMAWLWATERPELYKDWCTALAGAYTMQYFIVEEGQFDPHDDNSRPYIARRRQVQSITNGGRTVTVNTYPQNGNTGGDWNKMDFAKLDLVRESDGERAFIEAIEVTFPTGPNDMVLHLSRPISGLAPGNTVYAAAPLAMGFGPGTPEWRSAGTVWSASPSPSAAYRNLQFPAIHHLFVHAIGMSGSVTAPSVAYLKRAMAPGSGLPSQVPGVFGAMFGRADYKGNNWTRDFWAAHSNTILNLPQDV